MKDYHDQNATEPSFQPGDRVWVYTPQLKKGLAKKLLHLWHGPHRIIEELSPVHFRLMTCYNKPTFNTVHANRMKLYYAREDRPIGAPLSDVEDDYLDYNDLPPDSLCDLNSDTAVQTDLPLTEDTSDPFSKDIKPGHDELVDIEEFGPPITDNETIFRAEKLIDTRVWKGRREYLIKWEGFPQSENTWEPEDNIYDPNLIEGFNAMQKKNRCPRIAAFGVVSPNTPPMAPNEPVRKFSFTKVSSQLGKALCQLPTCVTLQFLVFIFFIILTCSGHPCPKLGPLFDCSRVYDQGVFHLNKNVHVNTLCMSLCNPSNISMPKFISFIYTALD